MYSVASKEEPSDKSANVSADGTKGAIEDGLRDRIRVKLDAGLLVGSWESVESLPRPELNQQNISPSSSQSKQNMTEEDRSGLVLSTLGFCPGDDDDMSDLSNTVDEMYNRPRFRHHGLQPRPPRKRKSAIWRFCRKRIKMIT